MYVEKQLFIMMDLQALRLQLDVETGPGPGPLCFHMIQISLFWLTPYSSVGVQHLSKHNRMFY